MVFDPQTQPEIQVARNLRCEWVIARGGVRRRTEGMENPKLATGEVEVAVEQLEVLNQAKHRRSISTTRSASTRSCG